MRRFRGVILSIFIVACYLQANVAAGSQDVSRYVSALRQLVDNWHGTFAEFETVFAKADFTFKRPKNTRLWTDRDGTIVRQFSDSVYETDFNTRSRTFWKLRTADMLFARNESWIDDREQVKVEFVAGLEGKDRPSFSERVYSPVGQIFGLDSVSGKYWFEILEDPNTRFSVHRIGEESTVKVKNSKFGRFEFTFREGIADEIPILKRIVCRKLKSEIDQNRNNYLSYDYDLHGIEIGEFDGLSLIEKMVVNVKYSFPEKGGRGTRSSEFTHQLVNIEKLNERLTEQISFPNLKIEDGTPVRVLNDEGIPYEVQGGFLVRVVGKESLVTAGNARFRQPQGVDWLWYLVMGLVVAVSIAVIAYKRES